MCYKKLSRGVMLFFLFCGIAHHSYANILQISLKKAMTSHIVTVGAVSMGGYCDKSISLELTNNTNKELAIDIDPALIFRPDDDTGAQNLVLLGNEAVALAPRAKANVVLQTFCGKSYGHSPRANLCYTYWRQGDSNMIRALSYVKEQSIPIHLAQRAVWMFTNGFALNSVYDHSYMRVSEDFVIYLAKLRHEQAPDFYAMYKIDSAIGHPAPTDTKVYVNMHWKHGGYYRHMYLNIFKENGDLYKRIEADQVIDKEGYTVTVVFDPVRDLKGVYYVQLNDDANQVWERRKVVVG